MLMSMVMLMLMFILIIVKTELALNFLSVQSQPDIRSANFIPQFVAYENSLCLLFSLIALCKLHELCFTMLVGSIKLYWTISRV